MDGELEDTIEETPPSPSRRTLWLLVTPLIVLSVAGTVANALTPALVKDHPLWLIALEPRGRNLVVTARKLDLLPWMLVAVFRRMLSDPLYFLLGHFYGERAVRWIERQLGDGGGVVRGLERAFSRYASVVVFLWPGALVCVLAGATRIRLRRFVVLNVLGTIFTATLIRLFAGAVSAPVDAILRFNERNFRWLTGISIALTVYWLISQRRAGRGRLSVDSAERELGASDEPPATPPG